MDSGCSKHITEDITLLSNFKKNDGCQVTFGNNAKGKIIEIENTGNYSSPSIENILLVDNFKHNFLNISQLCDKGYHIKFNSSKCLIKDATSNEIIFIESWSKDVYIISIEFESNEKCLSSLKKDTWLWYRRLGHVSMDFIS